MAWLRRAVAARVEEWVLYQWTWYIHIPLLEWRPVRLGNDVSHHTKKGEGVGKKMC